jgi:hypothetical protein
LYKIDIKINDAIHPINIGKIQSLNTIFM